MFPKIKAPCTPVAMMPTPPCSWVSPSFLAEMPDRPAGQIRFLFQPSEEASDEENKSGGMRMVEEKGARWLDAVIALHVASEQPAGTIMIDSGYDCCRRFLLYLTGTGGHGAYPHQTIDPPLSWRRCSIRSTASAPGAWIRPKPAPSPLARSTPVRRPTSFRPKSKLAVQSVLLM
ncbi:MAG: hypothetical protein R3E79_19265 [Caldilineaceae bacterium]